MYFAYQQSIIFCDIEYYIRILFLLKGSTICYTFKVKDRNPFLRTIISSRKKRN